MPLNVPTVTRDDVSAGPGRIFVGAAGATPTVDVGSITEDGIELELTSDLIDLVQGNPKLIELSLIQANAVMVRVSGTEWNFDNFANALGAGNTTVSGTNLTLRWGGEPCPVEVAVLVQHQMCRSGDTMNMRVWRARGSGNLPLPINHDIHNFSFEWVAMRSITEWDGTSLPSNEQLIEWDREL